MAQLGAGLQAGAICFQYGATYACGWGTNTVWMGVSAQADLEREALDGVSLYLAQVCGYSLSGTEDPPRSAIVVRDDGSVDVCVDRGGDMITYRSADGNTFTQVA